MADETLLRIYGFGVPPYSARGLTQTIAPIPAAVQLGRTINGALVDLSAAQFRKYTSSIMCNDQQPPAFDGIWPGLAVIVDCVTELAYDEYNVGSNRTVVPDSEREESGFIFYRPRLTMRIVNFSVSRDEYGHMNSWQLDLEEQ